MVLIMACVQGFDSGSAGPPDGVKFTPFATLSKAAAEPPTDATWASFITPLRLIRNPPPKHCWNKKIASLTLLFPLAVRVSFNCLAKSESWIGTGIPVAESLAYKVEDTLVGCGVP